jgi:hypothetical protein
VYVYTFNDQNKHSINYFKLHILLDLEYDAISEGNIYITLIFFLSKMMVVSCLVGNISYVEYRQVDLLFGMSVGI